MANTTISMGEACRLINYNIDNNKHLEDEGKDTIALGLQAEAGIGKTSIIESIAKERDMGFTKIVCSQLEEVGDLIGYPQVEYECQVAKLVIENNEKKVKVLPRTTWVSGKMLETPPTGIKYRQTGNTRMGYAAPAWVPQYNENGNIILFDDLTRANPTILQATMDLIYKKEFVSWKFPKHTTVMVTQNPDDGSYNVNSQDDAQNTRYLVFPVSWDADAWSAWAESYGLDGRCINFVLTYASEIFEADDQGNRICNPRSFMLFANMISGVKDWDDPDSLAFISMIAKGCFKDEQGRFANMFAAFLRNKMHLLIQPKEMLEAKWDTLKAKLKELLYDSNGQYRADIGSLLERRFATYVISWLGGEENTPIKKVIDRMVNFVDESTSPATGCIFTKDMFYHMVKTITSNSKNKNQTNKILFEPKLAKLISNQ